MRATRANGGHLRITRFALQYWRNFARVDVDLAQRAFMVGPNASGKSNLLDSIRFLHDVVAVGGGLQAAVARRGGVSPLRSLAARRYPDVGVHAWLGHNAVTAAWEYELVFGQDNKKRPIVKKEIVREAGRIVLNRPDEADKTDPARLSQTFLEQVNVNQQFRPVAEFFETIRYMHIVPQLVRDPDRSVGRRDDPFGGDFLEQVATTSERVRAPRLRRIAQALRVAVPQLSELQLFRDQRGTPHLRGRYEHWRPHAGWQTEDQFSDGTLRLLGLMWAALDGAGPLLMEEPELYLHPEVVRYLPAMLSRTQRQTNRQMLISTQSADLLRDPGIGLDEVLLLEPGPEGTSVKTAETIVDAKALLEGGSSLADIVIPRTRPAHTEQLALFGT
jgi:AAA domain, putative AbiEii toxin, Type IV TA system